MAAAQTTRGGWHVELAHLMAGALGNLFASWYATSIHAKRTRRVADSLGKLLERVTPIQSLLDVGGGDGLVAKHLQQRLGIERVQMVDILPRPNSLFEVTLYDGLTLPFESNSFDVVVLSDVLHHAEEPNRLLQECLRVARAGVAIKDHFAMGAVSSQLLWLMDIVGNHSAGVHVRGTYWQPHEWLQMVDEAGGRMVSLDWPVLIHDLPWRVVTRSELQFSALVEQVAANTHHAVA